MDNIAALFEVRDQHYFTKTTEIFNTIGTTLGCVTTYLSDMDDRIEQGIISWEDVTMADGMVVVIGMLVYDIGSVIDFEGKKVEITKDNAEQFQSMLHMQVPYDLVILDKEKDIMEYLYNLGNEDEITIVDDFAPPPAATLDMEFDLSELSEEQLQSLKLSTNKGGH